jgi:hypothetical protein
VITRPKALASLLLLAASAPSAQAQYLGSPFSYNFIELDYRMTEFDLAAEDLDGYYAHVSIESNKNIRVMARWGDATGTVGGFDAKRRDLELGLGFHQAINRQLDTTFDLKFLRSESQAYDTRSTDVGYGIEGGLRGFVTDHFELNGSLEFRDLVDTEVGGRFGAIFHFNRHVGLTAGYTYFSEQQSLHAGIRFSL